jgi:hypothetical protein
LQWATKQGYCFESTTITVAAKKGQLENIKWLIEEQAVNWDTQVFDVATKAGHLHVLQWFKDSGRWIEESKLEKLAWGALGSRGLIWTIRNNIQIAIYEFLVYASKRGHLNVLQLLVEMPEDDTELHKLLGEELDEDTRQKLRKIKVDPNYRRWPDIYGEAARAGHVEILDWLQDKKIEASVYLCNYAARAPTLDALKWAHENGFEWNPKVSTVLAKKHPEGLKWAKDRGCPVEASTCDEVAGTGNLEILIWLRSEGCPWTEQAAIGAVKGGHLEVLKWIKENEGELSYKTFVAAIESGDMNIISYLESVGCPLPPPYTGDSELPLYLLTTHNVVNLCEIAVQTKSVQVFKWAEEHGGMITDRTVEFAGLHNSLPIIRYIHSTGYHIQPSIYKWAAMQGCLNILEWAYAQGIQIHPETAKQAADWGYLHVIKWLVEKGVNINSDTSAIEAAAEGNNWELVKFFIENGCPYNARVWTHVQNSWNVQFEDWVAEKWELAQ